jgi:hypothetical protein
LVDSSGSNTLIAAGFEVDVLGLVDRAHAALADLAEDPVEPTRSPGSSGFGGGGSAGVLPSSAPS